MSDSEDIKKPEIANPELFSSFGFDDVQEWEVEVEEVVKKEKLDIFYTLDNADLKNKNFYSNLTPAMQKAFAPLIVMRWFSSVPDGSRFKDYYLIMTNEMMNVDFWALQKHPELQWKLMAMCGTGIKSRHQWIPMAGRKKNNSLIAEFMLQWYPSANDQELEILTSSMKRDDFVQFVKSTGATDAELRDILSAYDKEYGTVKEKDPKGKKRKA